MPAKVLTDLGHQVCLIAPQFVTPYVKSNKNDRNDAEAICEAISRPSIFIGNNLAGLSSTFPNGVAMSMRSRR